MSFKEFGEDLSQMAASWHVTLRCYKHKIWHRWQFSLP